MNGNEWMRKPQIQRENQNGSPNIDIPNGRFEEICFK